jgi:hypothetical protein
MSNLNEPTIRIKDIATKCDMEVGVDLYYKICCRKLVSKYYYHYKHIFAPQGIELNDLKQDILLMIWKILKSIDLDISEYTQKEYIFFNSLSILKQKYKNLCYNLNLCPESFNENSKTNTTKDNTYLKVDIDKIFTVKTISKLLKNHKACRLLFSNLKLSEIRKCIDRYFTNNTTDKKFNDFDDLRNLLDIEKMHTIYIDNLFNQIVETIKHDKTCSEITYIEKSQSNKGLHLIIKLPESVTKLDLYSYYFNSISKFSNMFHIPLQAFEYNHTQVKNNSMFQAGHGFYNIDNEPLPVIDYLDNAIIEKIDLLETYKDKIIFIRNNNNIANKNLYFNYCKLHLFRINQKN